VTRHLDDTVDRLIGQFGIGYLKLDYNINIGHGTDTRGRSLGAGLLDHNRAYSRWLDTLFARHPGLVVENCSSGGMRADYAQLSRLSVQSTSDQVDPVLYAAITASAASVVTPEQAAVWAYPQPDWSGDLNDLTLVNALLGRVHLSGRVDQLSPAARDGGWLRPSECTNRSGGGSRTPRRPGRSACRAGMTRGSPPGWPTLRGCSCNYGGGGPRRSSTSRSGRSRDERRRWQWSSQAARQPEPGGIPAAAC
jgi:hypothetical protein